MLSCRSGCLKGSTWQEGQPPCSPGLDMARKAGPLLPGGFREGGSRWGALASAQRGPGQPREGWGSLLATLGPVTKAGRERGWWPESWKPRNVERARPTQVSAS